jgi:hypothetical protein
MITPSHAHHRRHPRQRQPCTARHRVRSRRVIEFNETIDASNREALARRHVDETAALLDDRGWISRPRAGHGTGVTAFIRDIETRDANTGKPRETRVVLAKIRIAAARPELFSLVSEPKRAPEWDKTDRGFEWVDVFDSRDTVFRNFNKPLLRKIDSVLYRIVRPDHDRDRSLYCARSVMSTKAPRAEFPRLYQQIFAWAVRELDDHECELSVMASEPLGFLPAVIQRLVFMYGWRSNLVGIRKHYRP